MLGIQQIPILNKQQSLNQQGRHLLKGAVLPLWIAKIKQWLGAAITDTQTSTGLLRIGWMQTELGITQ